MNLDPMDESAFQQLIHPLVRYERVPLSPEANALPHWQAASRAVTNSDEISDLVYAFHRDCECGLAECTSCQPPPIAELTDRLTALVEANAEAIRCFDHGIQLGRLQLEFDLPLDFEGGLPLSGLRELAYLKTCEGRLHALQGDVNLAALACYQKALSGHMLADCDGSVVIFLVGLAVQGASLDQLLELAEEPTTCTSDLLAYLRKARDARIDDMAAVGVLRSEFCNWALPILKSLADLDSDGFLDHAADHFARELPAGTDDEFSESAIAYSKFYRRAFFELLEGHPQLWDARESIRAACLITAKQIAEILQNEAALHEIELELASWQARDGAFWSEWPESLGPFGMMPAMCDEWTPPPEWELDAVRDRLQRFDNPLGHFVVGQVCCVNPYAVQAMLKPALDARLSALLD